MVATDLCRCGCGIVVRPGRKFLRGHNVRVRVTPDEVKRKISESLKRYVKTEIHRKHLSESMVGKLKGRPNLKRRRRVLRICVICNKQFEVRQCEVHQYATCSQTCRKEYVSKRQKGKKIPWHQKMAIVRRGKRGLWRHTEETKKRISEKIKAINVGDRFRGKKLTEEHRRKISEGNKGKHVGGWKLSLQTRKNISDCRKGDRTHLWKGGITPKNKLIRNTLEYKIWRENVFKRDNFTCIFCGKHGGRFHADHIKPFALYPELRFDVDNGRTLCIPCHTNTDTYLWKTDLRGKKEVICDSKKSR